MSQYVEAGRKRYAKLKEERRQCPVCMISFIPTAIRQRYCCAEHQLLATQDAQRQLTFKDYQRDVALEIQAMERREREIEKANCPSGYISIPWIREAFRESCLTKSELSRRMGWGGATANVTRILNHEHCRYATAVKLVQALGIDPVDVDM